MRLRTFIPPARFATALIASVSLSCALSAVDAVTFVRSSDAVPIAVECAGAGPTLLIVHGGTGDRTRWTPLFRFLTPHFRVCAMDRRAHGASGDSPAYTLQSEIDDVVAVVKAQPGPVFVLGHSFGGLAALEAAFLTDKIAKLILYEPPLQDLDHAAVDAKMQQLIANGDRDAALVMFMREVVMISPDEIERMKSRPTWAGLRATVHTTVRQDRALATYRFDAAKMRRLQVPTLLLAGSKSGSPQLKLAIEGLLQSLPHAALYVFEGQEHNAMDTVPEQFSAQVISFLTGR
jgi:pimeloyl-ACP methyl ester carboxylesterase